MKHKLTKQEIFTIPNALSLFRILLIPLIVWLYVAREQRYAAVGLVALSGLTGEVRSALWYGKVSTGVFYGTMLLLLLFADMPEAWLMRSSRCAPPGLSWPCSYTSATT